MVVYLTAAAAALFYAFNLPIRFAFSLDVGETNALRVGVGLFRARYIYERRLFITNARMHQAYQQYDHTKSAPMLKAGLKAGLHLFRHARFSGARFSMRLGTSDAARTAMVCGAARALVDALNATGRIALPSKIVPDYKRRGLSLSAGGMVHVCLGHIMFAALTGVTDLVSRRIHKKWTGTQSKAS